MIYEFKYDILFNEKMFKLVLSPNHISAPYTIMNWQIRYQQSGVFIFQNKLEKQIFLSEFDDKLTYEEVFTQKMWIE